MNILRFLVGPLVFFYCHLSVASVEGATTSLRGQPNNRELIVEDDGTSGMHCGCAGCNNDVWHTRADTGDGKVFATCGSRIEWLIFNRRMSEQEACRQVAGEEFSIDCGACKFSQVPLTSC